MEHAEFLVRYPPHEPLRPHANSDELKKLGADEGVRNLLMDEADVVCNVPRCAGDDGCHLWVLNEEGIPFLLETAPIAAKLKSGVVKHTNLTGGGLASCGGELWFDPNQKTLLYLNGCSGRYGPRNAQELSDVETVFEDLGFEAKSFGWDHEAGLPAAVLR